MTDSTEKELFLSARRLPPSEREAFLRRSCPDDAAVRAVLELLRAAEGEGSHFEVILPANAGGEALGAGEGISDPASHRPDAYTPGTIIGQYRLLRLIGEGGMGVVYLAEHVVLGKRFALKFLKPGSSGDPRGAERAAARFMEEARLTARLNHPAIVQIVDLIRDGDRICIVSEYVEGVTLAELIADERTALEAHRADPGAPERDVQAWLRRTVLIIGSIADALAAAHEAGIVHCDVKPSNILIDMTHGDERAARLSDFGIARLLVTGAPTDQSIAILTPWYASPEQASVAAIDQRSDVFSLGVVLYEMLTLTRPFTGRDIPSVLTAIQQSEPREPRRIDPRIPKDLETICLRAMEKRPDRRYQSAGFISFELRSVRDGHPIVTPARSLSDALRRWIRRRRRPLAVAGIVALTVAAGWLALRNARLVEPPSGVLSLSIDGERQDADLSIAEFQAASMRFAAPDRRGKGNGAQVRLSPGLYRITLCSTADPAAFAEFDEWISAGTTSHRRVMVRSAPLGHERMRGVDGGRHMVHFDDARVGEAERRRSAVDVEAFLIDDREVTNGDYESFRAATGYPTELPFGTDEVRAVDPERWLRLPAVGLPREAMQAYAIWAGKRLPTIEEWIAAAEAPDGRVLPWAQEGAAAPDLTPSVEARDLRENADPVAQQHAYLRFVRTAEEAIEPPSPLGLLHMYGNVEESTASVAEVGGFPAIVIVGAMWAHDPRSMTLTRSTAGPMTPGSPHVGFRCVRSRSPHTSLPAPSR